MTSMYFSIIIPCYNSERYLSDTLDSVVAQTCPHFEAILVDDCSTDRTVDIAESYCNRDKRFRLIRLMVRSGGPATPRNIGIQASEGDYIALLDSDDIWGKDKLLHDREFLADHPADILYSGAYYFENSVENVVLIRPGRDLGPQFRIINQIPTVAICINRQFCIGKEHVFDPDPCLVAIEDYHFLLDAYLSGRRILRRPGIDCYYRRGSATSIYNRHDFPSLFRRHLYNHVKIAVRHAESLPRLFLVLSAMSTHLIYVRLRGKQ